MLGKAVAFATATVACLAAPAGRAQEREAEDGPTAEEMIEVAREEWQSPNLRGCPEAKPGEIVVCKPDTEQFRVESSTDEAIREGKPVPDGVPRAPDVFGLPPCKSYTFCGRVGRTPEPVLMIDLATLPHPLTPEEAAHVFRAEDPPQRAGDPEQASTEAAP